MRFHTKRGNLDVVQWLHEHGRHIHVLRYVYQHSRRRCSCEAVDEAAAKGYVDVVKLIVESGSTRKQATSQHAINYAARDGQLAAVKYLVESKTRLDALHVMDFAAGNGRLAVVKYLHEHLVGGCTTLAMDPRGDQRPPPSRQVSVREPRGGLLVGCAGQICAQRRPPDRSAPVRDVLLDEGGARMKWKLPFSQVAHLHAKQGGKRATCVLNPLRGAHLITWLDHLK